MDSENRFRILAVLAFLFAGLVSGMTWMGLGAAPTIESPAIRFASLPTKLGPWVGETIQLSDEELETLDAADEASFRFQNPQGRVAFVHVASWDDPQFVGESCPHHPEVCYRNTGWEILGESTVRVPIEIRGESTTQVPIKLLRMRRDEQRAVVGFVYEIGDQHFVDELGARRIQFGLLTKDHWPFVSKYLVQTSAESMTEAREVIEPLTEQLIRWHKRTSHTRSKAE